MPSAIHLGLRRPGIARWLGRGWAVAGSWLGCAGAACVTALALVALRGSMSMLMVGVLWAPVVRGGGWSSSGSPVGTMLAWAEPVPVHGVRCRSWPEKIVGSVAWVRT